jgi:chemotaxis protein CheD
MEITKTTTMAFDPTLHEDLNVSPGTIIVAHAPSALWSTIGSGVSVCVWNRQDRVGGMNHFLLPATNDPAHTFAKFGNVAMHGLMSILSSWTTIPSFEASIIGAAFSDEFEEENCRDLIAVAEKYLWKENIPVVLQETGGSKLRNITFDIETGRVCIM